MIDITEILKVAKKYQQDRKSLGWNQANSLQEIGKAFRKVGIDSSRLIDKTFFANIGKNKVFCLKIDEKSIECGICNSVEEYLGK